VKTVGLHRSFGEDSESFAESSTEMFSDAEYDSDDCSDDDFF